MGTTTQLDGTLHLPNGRTIPVVISVDLTPAELAQVDAIPSTDPLLLRAVEVFGKADKALAWLTSASPELGDRTPRDVAATPDGLDRVLGILLDREHGFPA